MDFLPPTAIVSVLYGRALWLLGAVGVAAVLCGAEAGRDPTATLGLFGATLATGWILAATLLTYLCGGRGLVLEPLALHGDFHALSSFLVRVRVGNSRRRWPALFLTVRLDTLTEGRALPSPEKFLGRLDPHGTAEFAWEITARMRGEYELRGMRVRTRFPGSVFSQECRFALSRKLLALPAVYQLDVRALQLLTGRRSAGGRLHATAAAMEEFIGVRDYRPGDNPRYIHRALSLRTADYPYELVVREFEDPSDDDVCVVLDTVILPAEADDTLLRYRYEKALSFAVGLCRLLTERRYRVRFRAVDQRGARIDVLLNRSARELPRLEVRLAPLRPVGDGRLVWSILDEESRRSNATVLFVGLRDVPVERVHRGLAALTVTPDVQVSLVRHVVGL